MERRVMGKIERGGGGGRYWFFLFKDGITGKRRITRKGRMKKRRGNRKNRRKAYKTNEQQ